MSTVEVVVKGGKKRSKDFRDHYGISKKFRVKVGFVLFSGMGRWKREGGPTWG